MNENKKDQVERIETMHMVQFNHYKDNPYECGLYNGLEIALSVLQGREPRLKKPKK